MGAIKKRRSWIVSATILQLLTQPHAMAQSIAACEPPVTSPLYDAQLSSLYADADILGKVIYQRERSKTFASDVVLSTGSVVDESCFEGMSEAEKAKKLKNLQEILKRALVRSQECYQKFEFPELKKFASVVRRTTFSCRPYVKGDRREALALFIMQKPIADNYRQTGLVSVFAKKAVPAGSTENPGAAVILTRMPDRPSEVDLDFEDHKEINWAYADLNSKRMKRSDGALDSQISETAVSVLFHEMLHFTSNATDWHNQADKRFGLGCNQSIFSDRIYLIQAACFPKDDRGVELRDPLRSFLKCGNQCEKSLMTVNAQAFHPEITKFSYRFGIVAQPLSEEQAGAVCKKLRSEIPKI